MARPDANSDYNTISKYDSDGRVKGNLLANDDANGGLGVKVAYFDHIYIGPKGGTNTIAGDYGTFTVYEDGSYTYKLDSSNPAVIALQPGETLVEKVSYKITNKGGETDVANLYLTISGTANRPDAVDDIYNPVTGDFSANVLVNDTDPNGDALKVVSAGTNNTLQVFNGSLVVAGAYGTLTINQDGSFNYDLDESNPSVVSALSGGPSVTDSFVYKIYDGGLEDNTDTARIKFVIDDGVSF